LVTIVQEHDINDDPTLKKNDLLSYPQIGIALILVLSPFFRGLYFIDETLDFLIFIGIITGFVGLTRLVEKDGFPRPYFDLMDLGFAGLALWYLLSIPFAASIGDAILGAIRVLGYASLYYVSCQLLTKRMVWMGAWIWAFTASGVDLCRDWV